MNQIKAKIIKYKLQPLVAVFWFCLITITIHILWRLWAHRTHYWPIEEEMSAAGLALAHVAYEQSSWFIIHILGTDITMSGHTMYFPNNGFIGINPGCSGLKPIVQFVLLMMIFPGPWKRKIWFIPMGIVIVHLTNLFRIIGLSVVMMNWPEQWHFSHDYLFRPFFYVVIFGLWVLWVERLMEGKRQK